MAASGAVDLAGIPHLNLLTPKWGPLLTKVLYVLKKPGTTCPWECAASAALVGSGVAAGQEAEDALLGEGLDDLLGDLDVLDLGEGVG